MKRGPTTALCAAAAVAAVALNVLARHYRIEYKICEVAGIDRQRKALRASRACSEGALDAKYADCEGANRDAALDVDVVCAATAFWRTLEVLLTHLFRLVEPQSWQRGAAWLVVATVASFACVALRAFQARVRELSYRGPSWSEPHRVKQQHVLDFSNFNALPYAEVSDDD